MSTPKTPEKKRVSVRTMARASWWWEARGKTMMMGRRRQRERGLGGDDPSILLHCPSDGPTGAELSLGKTMPRMQGLECRDPCVGFQGSGTLPPLPDSPDDFIYVEDSLTIPLFSFFYCLPPFSSRLGRSLSHMGPADDPAVEGSLLAYRRPGTNENAAPRCQRGDKSTVLMHMKFVYHGGHNDQERD
ncbi:hypothetical protein BDZ89DRAFT_1037172 [Hymenopellis radicata]|nr:hypothetical protein BDZ89DRAFT_1037172 [Hymenopellis radicata]